MQSSWSMLFSTCSKFSQCYFQSAIILGPNLGIFLVAKLICVSIGVRDW